MSASYDLQTINSLINLSIRAVEETCSKCQEQLPRLYNQRQALLAKRMKQRARQEQQKRKLEKLCSSLGLVTPVE